MVRIDAEGKKGELLWMSSSAELAIYDCRRWEFPKITLTEITILRPHLFYDQAWLADQGGSDESLGSIGTGVKWSGFSHYSSSLELALPMNKFTNEPRNAVVYFSFNTVW